MAWTSPRTWVAGELVTASILNTHIRDNLNYLFGSNGGQAFNSGAVATSNTFYTVLGTFVANTAGRRCLWWFTGTAHVDGGADGSQRRASFKFFFDGGEVGVPVYVHSHGGSTERFAVANTYLNIPAAAAHTFQIAYRCEAASHTVTVSGFYFIVVEA